ncbi:RNA 2',3'-cyclic phosphodiesterase [bacterium]|nr:RNA 2',3'-cyclic phosphodiesterase [bacterium]
MRKNGKKETDTIRAFIAIDTTDEAKRALEETALELRDRDCRVTWVKPDKMHLTVKFLGDIDEEQADELGTSLDRVAAGFAPFDMALEGVGAFPNPKRARVVWVGIEEDPLLVALHGKIESAAEAVGVERDPRSFRPHLTLGRVKELPKRSGLPGRIMDATFERLIVPVEELILFRSELTPKGPIYTALHRARLGG